MNIDPHNNDKLIGLQTTVVNNIKIIHTNYTVVACFILPMGFKQ